MIFTEIQINFCLMIMKMIVMVIILFAGDGNAIDGKDNGSVVCVMFVLAWNDRPMTAFVLVSSKSNSLESAATIYSLVKLFFKCLACNYLHCAHNHDDHSYHQQRLHLLFLFSKVVEFPVSCRIFQIFHSFLNLLYYFP